MSESISTQYLVDLIFANPKKMLEIRLLVSRFVVATHFVYFNGRNLYDEGIDGENRKVKKEEFIKNYQNNYWVIDTVV